MMSLMNDIKSLWIGDIVRRNKVTPFIVFIFFLITFIVTRLMVLFFPDFNILGMGIVESYEIHHYFLGIVLLLISGWVVLVTDSLRLKRISAAFYGVGFGLIIDEIGLLLTCGTTGLECDYWARITYDVVTYVVVGFLLIIYFGPFWKVFHGKIKK